MTIEDLARDVESLKSENRRLRRWGGAAALLALALGAMAMAQEETVPEVVRAKSFRGESFELVTASGSPMATLKKSFRGGGGMLSFDGPGLQRLEIGTLGEAGVGMLIVGESSRSLTIGTNTSTGTLRLKFTDGENDRGGELGLLEDGRAGLIVRDDETRTTAEVGTRPRLGTVVRVSGEDGKVIDQMPR